jgi:hypothetical protein
MWSLSLSLSVGCSVEAESPQSQKQSRSASVRAPGAMAALAPYQSTKCIGALKCQKLQCGGAATTRKAVITFGDNGILDVTDTICACAGDTIEWTYDNQSDTLDKDVKIKDMDSFLEDGPCKDLKTVTKSIPQTATCAVMKKEKVKSGCKAYEVQGTHQKDPEVEVQGGNTDRGSPGTSSPSPSPIP